MANFSFSQGGSNPKQGYLGGSTKPVSPFGIGSTPQGNALSNSQAPNMSTPQGPRYSPPPVIPSASTPVKKTTVSNVDGSSHTTEYHAPTPPTPGILNPPAAPTNQSTGGNAVIPTDTTGTYTPQTQETPKSGSPQSSSPTYPGLIGSLADVGKNGSAGYNNAVDKLSSFRRQVAGEQANISQVPIELSFQQGRQQVLTQKAAVEDAALQNAVNQQQTQQGQQITALNNAASLARKQVTEPGQAVFDPLTGQYTSASSGGGNPSITPSGIDQTSWDNYVNMAVNGQYSAIPSSITSNTNLSGQLNAAAKLKNPNFSPITSTAQGDATAANTKLGGTVVPSANASIYTGALGDYYSMNSQLQNVDQLGSLLLKTAGGAQINPFDPQLANQSITWLRGQLSSPDQARFNSTLATFQGAAQQLLASASGGLPTDVSNKVNEIASGSLSLGALKALVDQAKQEGTIKLQNQAGIVNQARSGTLGGNTGSAGANTGGAFSDSAFYGSQ